MNKRHAATSALILALLLVLTVGLSQAQGPEPPEGEVGAQGEASTAAVVGSRIPLQGRLADASGNPLSGTYSIRFRLYDDADTVLCEDTHSVTVADGFFNTHIDGCTSSDISGQQLYLGVRVGTDPEMTPRQPIYPVPYALSLRPGAIISDTNSYVELNRYDPGGIFPRQYGVYATAKQSGAVVASGLYGTSDAGTGVQGHSESGFGVNGSSSNVGVRGVSDSGKGVLGVSESGPGVEGFSFHGTALAARGTGIIQSTAKSYLWISGNSLQKANSDDTTEVEYDLYGGYKVYNGSDWTHPKTMLLSVTIPGQLYGQNVTVTGLDLYYQSSDDLTGISITAMRRQNGVGAGDLIFWDGTDYVCPSGPCTLHWDLTENNVLSNQQGILYIAVQFGFSSASSYVQIGGARLTLEHE